MVNLKNVLLLNALSSGATGIGLLLASDLLADVFGTRETQAFGGVGIFLIVFAMLVYVVGRQKTINANAVRLIICADTLWVVVSMTIVLFQIFHISAAGYLIIAAVAMWVAAMAYFQFIGLNRIVKTS